MAGHNKWSKIKHKKAANDAKRGKSFTKVIREITVAAKSGGGDPDSNPRLRTAILAAKSENMPADNIERAIKKGTGELEGVNYDEVTYEGYGAQGVAILAECLTDNKNRSAAEIRAVFGKAGGTMAGAGSVAWMFEKKGFFFIPKEKSNEDQLMEVAIGAGAEDLETTDEGFEVITDPADFMTVLDALEKAGIEPETKELTAIPKNTVDVTADNARSILRLIENLEDHDDVQNVYTNSEIPDEVIEELGA